MALQSLWGQAGMAVSDPGPAPLSGQVLSWPVDPDENSVPSKEGQELKRNGAKVGCQERATTKFYLSCKNSDGRTRTFLLGQSGVTQISPKAPPFLWGEGSSCWHTLDRRLWWAWGWVGFASL